MSYNLLKNAISIQNSKLCLYDNNTAYSTDFSINGDVDGWNIYYDINLYGCWNNILFGTAYNKSPYISRSDVFKYVDAEKFYYVKLMLHTTNNNDNLVAKTLTRAKVEWTTIQDSVWNEEKSYTFDIIQDNQWHLYVLNLGPEKYWIGEINNLRVYPFIDGRKGDQFAIKYIKISSSDTWNCTNTSCDYYQNYTHDCKGSGTHASIIALQAHKLYTTISGQNDLLEINIDGYGNTQFLLGTNIEVRGQDMVKIIANKISSLDLGGYGYVAVEYTEFNSIKIISGTSGDKSSIIVINNKCSQSLGFFDVNGNATYKIDIGMPIASGFDYASTNLLTSFEINKLINGDIKSKAYTHVANNYSIEAGRKDYNEIGMNISSTDLLYTDYTKNNSLSNRGNTFIDWSHPVNNNGILKKIIVAGKRYENSKVKLCRPKLDGTLEVIYELTFQQQNGLISRSNVIHSLECSILVSKGDVFAFYDFDLSTGTTMTGLPDATYSQVSGEVKNVFDPGTCYSYGVGGFIFYAHSNRFQTNALLDIDLGNRYNVKTVNIYGKEEVSYFDLNIVSCLDVHWEVDLHNLYHNHNVSDGVRGWTETHRNIYYGIESLGDMMTTAENGLAGLSYGRDDNGLWTSGKHSYFYVNGDAEWLQPEEFGDNLIASIYGFNSDRVTFNLVFPQNALISVHKLIMYFKERKNFRSFSIYYGLGNNDFSGTYLDVHHKLIPSFKSITLDGIKHLPSDNILHDYLFKNPADATIQYDAQQRVKNFDHLRGVVRADWLVLGYEFDEVKCHGFNIDCTEHYSTKITEIELYSKVRMDPSLVDNVVIQYSSYGDVWNIAEFSKVQFNDTITANIGGAPRYFKMSFESPINFYLNEVDFLSSDNIVNTDCSLDITLDAAATNKYNDFTKVDIYNVYNKAFDLYVDIPRNLTSKNDLLFWSSFNSSDRLETPEVGPGCILKYRKDLPIKNNNKQCAINTPVYGLNNLVDGKTNYLNKNGFDWVKQNTLVSGTSLDLSLGDYLNTRVVTITLPKYSGNYWKLQFGSVLKPNMVKDILAFDAGIRVPISTIYLDQDIGYGSMFPGIVSDGTDIDVSYIDNSNFNDSFTGVDNTLPDSKLWHAAIPKAKIQDNKLSFTHTAGINELVDTDSNFICSGDFEVQVDFDISPGDTGHFASMTLCAYNTSNNIFRVGRIQSSGTTYKGVRNEHGDLTYSYATLSTAKFKMNRTGDKWSFYVADGGSSFSALLTDYSGFTDLAYIRLEMSLPSTYPQNTINFDNLVFNSGVGFYPTISNGVSLGFRTKYRSAVDTIKLVTRASNIVAPIAFNSSDNKDYYLLGGSSEYSLSVTDHYLYLAIDLINRHNIDIIRNYGEMDNHLFISTTDNVSYSNTVSSDISEVVIGNSNSADARWVNVVILASNNVKKSIDKLGIYPNIKSAYCIGGGYNCSWEPLGTVLSDYVVAKDIALNAAVDGIYTAPLVLENAVNGDYTDEMSNCWGFENDGVAPYIDILLSKLYVINKVVIYQGYNNTDTTFLNTSYTIAVSTTISGDNFVNVVERAGNTSLVTQDVFSAVESRRVRITINGYNSTTLIFNNNQFNGSFIREIEIYPEINDLVGISSEDYPIVAMDLLDNFSISGHSIENYHAAGYQDWDNSEQFFYYSDSISSAPNKVRFSDSGSIDYALNSSYNSGKLSAGPPELSVAKNVYLQTDKYTIDWECYDYNGPPEEISLVLVGNELLEVVANATGNTVWSQQKSTVNVNKAGFYDVFIKHIYKETSDWGVRNIQIYRQIGYGRWIAVKRDTATNYAYGDDNTKFGQDYIGNLKVYGNTEYIPTEYHWWWESGIGKLSNDFLKVKTNKCSLHVNYPASDKVDYIKYLVGDNFGIDKNWSIKDFLSFWIYISDIDRINVDSASVYFGMETSNGDCYYKWDLSNSLSVSGWNEVRLKFEEYTMLYPPHSAGYFMPENFNLQGQSHPNNYIQFNYQGKGESFDIYITDIHIERNKFDEKLNGGNGLLLYDTDYLLVPVSGITLSEGTIELWLKPYYSSKGLDIFRNTASRTIFSIINNNNELVSLGIKSGSWFELVFGAERADVSVVTASEEESSNNVFNIDTTMHLAVVWGMSGTKMSNGDTLRFYINNKLVYSTKSAENITDVKSSYIKLSGGNTPLAYNYDVASGGGVYKDLKIYNYCKTDFSDRYDAAADSVTYKAEDFLLVSKDGTHFYNNSSGNLPLIYEQVPAKSSVPVYIQTYKNNDFKYSNKTADLEIVWLTSV